MENTFQKISPSIGEKISKLTGINIPENATIGDIYSLIKGDEKTIQVKLHIGRKSVRANLGFDMINLEGMDNEEQKKLQKILKGNEAEPLDVELLKKLRSIENGTRQMLKKMTIGDTSFIRSDKLEEFFKYFEEKKQEYFDIRDRILEDYDESIERFKEEMQISVRKLNPGKEIQVMRAIKSSIPSKESYKDSFYMEMSFNEDLNIEIFEIDTQKKIKTAQEEHTLHTIKEMVGKPLNEVFTTLQTFMGCIINKNQIHPKTEKAVRDSIRKAKANNVLQNEVIDNIAGEVSELILLKDSRMAAIRKGKSILQKLYQFSVDAELLEYLDIKNSMYSIEELTEEDE